jgi:hypothetical protein
MISYIFINCSWVATRWQQFSTHLHTNSTQNDTKQTIHKHKHFRKSVGRAPSLRVLPWHLPYNWGKSTEKPQSTEKPLISITVQRDATVCSMYALYAVCMQLYAVCMHSLQCVCTLCSMYATVCSMYALYAVCMYFYILFISFILQLHIDYT